VVAADAGLTPRCAIAGDSFALGAPGAIEIGDAVEIGGDIAIGEVRATPQGRVASIALVANATGHVDTVDLGPLAGDDPPPKPFRIATDLFAARLVRSPSRALTIARIERGKASETLATIPQQNESLAFDVAAGKDGALLAWDEDAPDAKRGIIKTAVFPTSPTHAGNLSGLSDAEAPRVFDRAGGFWLVWLARRVEPRDAGADAGPSVEAPGELRTFTWIEGVALDNSGQPAGPVRRITPENGHTGAFDGASRETGELDLFVRDDEEPALGAGSRLVRITLRAAGVDPPQVLVPGGLARALPAVASSALVYADLHDHAYLMPLDPSHAPLGPPSPEPILDRAIPLLSGFRANLGLLAAFPADGALKALSCR
jgi:hypothetical protein